MATTRQEAVLAQLVAHLAQAAGLDDVVLSAEVVSEVGGQDLFSGRAEIDGHPLDSLALTDDERADDARSLADLVEIMLTAVPADIVDAWLARHPGR
jgi:hypothetical protein